MSKRVARETGGAYVAVHPKSAVVHQPGPVFEAARQGPVLLQERSGEEFVLVARALSDRSVRGGVEAARVLALVQSPPDDFPKLPGFAWTAGLPVGERVALRDDLLLALRRSLEGESWDTYDAEVESWRTTAEAHADPEVAADLLADWERSGEVDLHRPQRVEDARRRPWLRRPAGRRQPPEQRFTYRVRGKNRGVETAWERLVVQYANEARACFDWLATHPTRRLLGRCAPLKGELGARGIWQYEVGGGSRVWYVVREDEHEVVVLRAAVGHPKETE